MTSEKHTAMEWDLEEVPYETSDPAGGWYLHFDLTGETTDAALYMSKANVTEQQANLIAAAPRLLRAAKDILVVLGEGGSKGRPMDLVDFRYIKAMRDAIKGAEG